MCFRCLIKTKLRRSEVNVITTKNQQSSFRTSWPFKFKTNLTPPLFFRCLYQARNVRCHVYMCFKGIDFVRISTILQFIWNCSDWVVNFCLLCYFHISAVVFCLTFSINEKQKKYNTIGIVLKSYTEIIEGG